MKELVIVGGGVAGLTAAVYARRAGIDTTVIESTGWGGQIAQSPEVENFPSIKNIPGWTLSDNLKEQAEELGAEFKVAQVSKLELTDCGCRLLTGSGDIEARAAILANGVTRKKLNCPGEDEFTGKGVSWCAVCDGPFFKGKEVAVIGGGNSAFEEALHLCSLCKTIYLIHRRNEFRAQNSLIRQVESKGNIKVITPFTPAKIFGGDRVEGIIIKNNETNAEQTLNVSGVFVSVGMDPNNAFSKGVIDTDEYGYYAAGENCRTNVPCVFVAGDCRQKPLKQLVTAMADGAVAATAAVEFLESSNKS